jgi:hypothetical protein
VVLERSTLYAKPETPVTSVVLARDIAQATAQLRAEHPKTASVEV